MDSPHGNVGEPTIQRARLFVCQWKAIPSPRPKEKRWNRKRSRTRILRFLQKPPTSTTHSRRRQEARSYQNRHPAEHLQVHKFHVPSPRAPLHQRARDRLTRQPRPRRHEEGGAQAHADGAHIDGDLPDQRGQDGGKAAQGKAVQGREDDGRCGGGRQRGGDPECKDEDGANGDGQDGGVEASSVVADPRGEDAAEEAEGDWVSWSVSMKQLL